MFMKLGEVGKNLWNVSKCLPKMLASVWETNLIVPICLFIIAFKFFTFLEKLSLEKVVLAVLKISDLYIEWNILDKMLALK